jgi:hypothetical protein
MGIKYMNAIHFTVCDKFYLVGKSYKIRWAWHVAQMRRGETLTGFWWGNLRERDHWGDPGVNGMIILRWIFRK